MADDKVFRPDMTASWRPLPRVSSGYPQQLTLPTWGGIGSPEHPGAEWDAKSPSGLARKVVGLGNLGMVNAYAIPPWWLAVSTVSGAFALYHGYKRHRGSLAWGLGWFALGSLFPVITPVVAVAQGYAKPAR